MKNLRIVLIKNNRSRGWHLSKALVNRGYEVIFTTNLPISGWNRIEIKSSGHLIKREKIEGVEVLAVPVLNLPWKNRNILAKLFIRLSFGLNLLLLISHIKKVDIIVNCGPHPFTDLFAFLLKTLRNSLYFMDVSDVEIESLKTLKMNKKMFLILNSLSIVLNKIVYSLPNGIIAHNSSIKKLISKYTDKEIYVVYNPVDLQKFYPMSKYDALNRLPRKYRHKFRENNFVITYIGKIGPIQDLRRLIDVAVKVQEKKILILIIGNGEEKEKLRNTVIKMGIKNIMFIDFQPWNVIPFWINMADVCLLPLSDAPIWKIALPSKFFEYAACGKPIISFCPRGEVTELIKRWEAGVSVDPSNPSQLARVIQVLSEDKKRVIIMGRNARIMTEKLFSIKKTGEILDKIFLAYISRNI